MNHNYLSPTERYQIQAWLEQDVTKCQIARRLGRHRSTIYRELAGRAPLGLVRQFIPKGEPLSLQTRRSIARIEHLLNNRPRACLGFKTPAEVLFEQRSQCRDSKQKSSFRPPALASQAMGMSIDFGVVVPDCSSIGARGRLHRG